MIMRKIAILLFSLLSFVLVAQNSLDSTRISTTIPVFHADRTAWLQRYQGDIDRYDRINKEMDDFTCDALFLGSSSFNLWDSLFDDMAPLKVIRRSYGGSTVRDNIYNYQTVARGYKPKTIAIYIENDLGKHPEALTPGELYDLFRVFIGMLRNDYPGVPIFFVSLKPSFAKWDQYEDQLIINSLMKDYAERTPGVEFIDIRKEMFDENGKLREDIFVSDRLHINAKGYENWTKAIKPRIMEAIKKEKQ